LMLLYKHEQTGGVTVLRKFRAGVIVPAHVHANANEFAYVLSGEWEESGLTYSSGTFFFAPRGTVMLSPEASVRLSKLSCTANA